MHAIRIKSGVKGNNENNKLQYNLHNYIKSIYLYTLKQNIK